MSVVAGAGSGSGNISGSERNAKTREMQNAFMYLNRVAGTNGSECARVINEMFTYLATTNHILLNRKFFDTIVNQINQIVDTKPDIYPIIKDSLSVLCEKMRAINPDVEIRGCAERVAAEITSPIVYKKLGSGGFGAVLSPALPNTKNGATVEFPENVTKIFFTRRNKEKLLEKLPTVQRVMGSYPEHRVNNYTRSYKFQNLPPSAQHILRNVSRRREILPTNTIHAVHMPYLGFDITDTNLRAHYKHLRKIPVVKIVSEIVKLMSQLNHLYESGYVHGDVRETNIMIHPESGTMTLIDFDWVKTYEQFMDSYPFGFYSNPLEYLLFNEFENINGVAYLYPEFIEDNIDSDQLNDYVSHHFNRLKFWSHGMEFRHKRDFRTYLLGALVDDANIIQERVADTVHNYYNVSDAVKDIFIDQLVTFDMFGLGISILSMFSYLYPDTITTTDISDEETPAVNERVKESLRERISNNGRSYNDEELDAIVVSLRKLSYLLYMMCNLNMSFRPHPAQALREARAILSELSTKLEATETRETGNELRRMAVIAGNLSALPTIGGRRFARRTYRRRRGSKSKKTRRSNLRPAK